MAFAPFLHGMPGPIVRPPSIGAPPMQNGGGFNRFNRVPGIQPQPMPVGGIQGPQLNNPGNHILPPGGGPAPIFGGGFNQQQPIGGMGSQSVPLNQMQGQQPIASYDHLDHVHTITKSGLYRLKKGEKVVPLASLAHA